MSSDARWPEHGHLGYLQLPGLDVAAAARFYRGVFGWRVDEADGTFRAPGFAGHWTADPVAAGGGPLLWLCVDDLYAALHAVVNCGGQVVSAPRRDQGSRWLADVIDPAGNRLGLVARSTPPQPQIMLAVRDVEASSRWYQRLLGLTSDHGGAEYERLLADGVLVLQLHQREVDHDHGTFATPGTPLGNGVLVWFGEVADFDGVVGRAGELGAPIVLPPHRNPPSGGGNGPAHREIWVRDPDGYVVVVASPDGEAWELE